MKIVDYLYSAFYKVKALRQRLLHTFRNYKYHFFLLIQQVGNRYRNILDTITILLSLFTLGNIVWQIGFNVTPDSVNTLLSINTFSVFAFAVIQLLYLMTYYRSSHKTPVSELIYATITWIYVWFLSSESAPYQDITHNIYFVTSVVALLSIYEISRLGISILSKRVSPTTLFALSFILIICLGCGLLLMPRCTIGSISFIEALFTATSAVCVSGLSVVNIADTFTPFGQFIIMLLIQVGGIGVMTFTCFFALSVNGKTSFQNRIVIKELISAESITNIFTTLKRIIIVTIIIEALCAWLIFNLLTSHPTHMEKSVDTMFTAVFHAISAFCNAGFSNFTNGLCESTVCNNYPLLIVVGVTVFIGGSGFPIQSSIIDWVKHHIKKVYYHVTSRQDKLVFQSRLINANERLIFTTHLSLCIAGTIIFFITEYNNPANHGSFQHNLTNSFMLSAMSRTAGFNAVSLTSLTPLSLAFTSMFIWVGCAPLSTGGGIKTSTFALAILNLKRILLRKENIEIYNRRVEPQSIDKAFAVIFLSLLFIASTTIALKVFNPEIAIEKLFFESVSAICTGGMTLDITPILSTSSHMVLILAMFIGRIGILSFLIMFITPAEKQYHKYPYENITT